MASSLTAGVHYKYNDGISEVNNHALNLLNANGISRQQGVDYTLYASKLFTTTARPVLLEAGGRATKASGMVGGIHRWLQLRLLKAMRGVRHGQPRAGARNTKHSLGITGRLAAWYGRKSDWWTIDAAYVVNKH